jgi:D-sedoheptulose 7-phosphate isomerase
MKYIRQYLEEVDVVLKHLEVGAIDQLIQHLAELRNRGGRLFLLGVGGGAANASHAVNDFRKLAGIEAYSPTDNVSELTARVNDQGWNCVFVEWLKVSRLSPDDLVFVLSVGGGNASANVSPNLVCALDYAREVGTPIVGIVGRDGGYTAQMADACIIVPTVNLTDVTPLTESFQAVIWHLLVSHPRLKTMPTKWETVV